jgi:hypothetical protein
MRTTTRFSKGFAGMWIRRFAKNSFSAANWIFYSKKDENGSFTDWIFYFHSRITLDPQQVEPRQTSQNFFSAFIGLGRWMGKNLRLILLLEAFSLSILIFLCWKAPIQIEGKASIHLISPSTSGINQFFEQAKQAEMQANADFWPKEITNSNQNPIQFFGLLLPKHNETGLLDSAHFTVRFSQVQNEPDSFTGNRICEILNAAILKDSVSTKLMQAQYRSMLQLDREIESAKVILSAVVNEPDTAPKNRINELLQFLQKSRQKYARQSSLRLEIESLEKQESRSLRPAILIGILIQAGLSLFFLLRFLLQGK